jgi:hypothetical protein
MLASLTELHVGEFGGITVKKYAESLRSQFAPGPLSELHQRPEMLRSTYGRQSCCALDVPPQLVTADRTVPFHVVTLATPAEPSTDIAEQDSANMIVFAVPSRMSLILRSVWSTLLPPYQPNGARVETANLS